MPDDFWQQEAKRLTQKVMELEEECEGLRRTLQRVDAETRERLQCMAERYKNEIYFLQQRYEVLVEMVAKREALKPPPPMIIKLDPKTFTEFIEKQVGPIAETVGIPCESLIKAGDLLSWDGSGNLCPIKDGTVDVASIRIDTSEPPEIYIPSSIAGRVVVKQKREDE